LLIIFTSLGAHFGTSVNERARTVTADRARFVISTFKIAESMGFKGDFRQWEELLRIGD
jgi:hypothetical protein